MEGSQRGASRRVLSDQCSPQSFVFSTETMTRTLFDDEFAGLFDIGIPPLRGASGRDDNSPSGEQQYGHEGESILVQPHGRPLNLMHEGRGLSHPARTVRTYAGEDKPHPYEIGWSNLCMNHRGGLTGHCGALQSQRRGRDKGLCLRAFDPIRFEVIRNALLEIVEEMAISLRRRRLLDEYQDQGRFLMRPLRPRSPADCPGLRPAQPSRVARPAGRRGW